MASFYDSFKESSYKKKKNPEEERNDLSFAEAFKANSQVRFENDDIAPVRQDTDDRKWFQKGAFEDGYQFGDLSKTISATGEDLRAGLISGILGMGERVVDAGAYAVGLFGSDKFKDKMQDFIAKDLYDERAVAEKIVKGTSNPLAIGGSTNFDDSVLGAKSDSLVESGGQLLGTVALQSVGVPWFVTSGVTSFGGEVENASNQGASYGEAGLSAAISAGVEIATEKMFGGSGLGEKGLFNLDGLTKGISNKVAKALADVGVDMAAEGMEEVVSQIGSNFASALYQEENLNELLFSEEAFDGYLESFIGGAALGGVANVGKTASSIKTGRDYRTGLTANEQTVFDKAYEDALAEAEKGGKKLTEKQKNELYDNVMESLKKGEVGVDTIESLFGGEDYKAYKSILEQESPLREELRSIENNDTLTDEQKATLTKSVEEKLQQLAKDTNKADVRAKLDKVMQSQMIRQDGKKTFTDDYLLENYNQDAKRRQAFEADVSKYDAKQQEIVKKAIESGVLNNTRRTHELVDMIAKISADKGVSFDFINNKKLKESGFAVDGKTVNGYYNKATKTIGVNIEGAKYLNSVVGHEVTHVLEGTEVYTELQKAMFEYAKSKGEYDSRRKALESLYKAEDIDSELTADLVGDYLFTDADFIKNLSTKNRNVFQKIYDEIKYLCKVATAGSKEARELERVKKAFEDVYRESGTQESTDGAEAKTKHSLGYHAGDLGKAEGYHMQGGYRGTGHFGTGTYFVGDEAKISNDSTYGNRPHHAVEFDNYTLYKVHTDKDGYRLHDNLHALDRGVSQEFLDAAISDKYDVSSLRYEAFKLAEQYDSKEFDSDIGVEVSTDYIGASIRAMSDVAEANNVEFQIYDEWLAEQGGDVPKQGDSDYEYYKRDYHDYLRDTLEAEDDARNEGYPKFRDAYFHLWLTFGKNKVNQALQAVVDHQSAMENGGEAVQYGADSNATVFMKALGYEGIDVRGTGLDNVAYGSVIYDLKGEDLRRKNEIGTARYSLSDSDGKQLTKEQSEYFKDSKMRDENGNLKVMYHGSQDAGFHEFDSLFSDDNASFFFVDRNDVAASYSGSSETYTARTFRTAEDFNKFFAEIGQNEYEVKEEMYGDHKWFVLYEDGSEVASSETAKMLYDEFRDWSGLGEGQANYKVYLNLTNPLEIDANGRPWNKIDAEFSQEVYDKYQSLTAEEKDALTNLAEWEDFRIFNSEIQEATDGALASAYAKMGEDCNIYDLFSVAADNFSEESMRENARGYLNTRDFAQRAKEQGYDGVIFKNLIDNGGYSNGSEGASTVAIAFDSNQIKSVANAKPTGDPDIRYSLGDGREVEVVNGIAVAPNVAEVMKSDEYQKPNDYMTQYSVSSTPAWEKNYLAQHHDEKDYQVVDAIRNFTDKMVQDDAVRGYVPTGDYKYTSWGPLRTNQEYIRSFDMDTSCPRTFQFLNFRDAIQRKAGRYLSYNESINLLELMRAYGQQIPCCYCYVENKRVLLSASYNNFFGFRNAVMTAQTDADAEKAMYGYSEKKGLPDASRKAMSRWRSDMSYNPSLTEVWTATNTARNSVLNYLDAQMESGNINEKTAESKLNKMVLEQFGITDKSAITEVQTFVRDWAYDTLAKIPHIYNTDNDTSVSAVDERALALNHEALAYAKSASSAKNVENYVPYTDQLKNISKEEREYIMGMGGIRKHSSNDFRMDYVQDYFLFYADLAADKWTGHTYTKSADFTKIFACTNDRINMSVAFYEDADGTLRENIDEGASWKDVRELRKAYKNVGAMAMVTSDNQLSYALNSDWVDMIIPFHASSLDKAVWYNLRMWNDYTSKQGERFYNADTMKQRLTEAGVEVPKGANSAVVKALFEDTFQTKHIYGKDGEILKPHFFPGDTYVNGQLVPGHHNDVATYFKLCEEYGVHPRFYGIKVTDTNGNQIDVTEHPSYLKLIKETSRTDSAQEEIQFNFGNYDSFLKMTPFEYAMKRLQEEAKNGGFENTKDDPYGVVDEFINEYLDKDRPLGYLTDRAKETREILLEMSKENAKKQADIVEKEVNALSLSAQGETPTKYGNFNISGDDVRLEAPMQESVAPVQEDVANNATTAPTISKMEQVAPEGFAPIPEEKANALQSENIASITDKDAPPEAEAPYYEEPSAPASPKNPFTDRDYTRVGSTKTKAFVEENPDAQPYFQEAAQAMLGDLRNSQKGQRWYNDRVYYESGGVNGLGGVQRDTTADIADLLDGHYHYTYQQIDDALNFIINGEKLNACAKRIEFALNERLLNGYTDINGMQIPPNQEYINLLNKMQTAEAINLQGQASATFTDSDAPPATEDIGPVKPTEAYQSQPKPTEPEEKVAQIRRADPKKEGSWWSRTKKKINDIITLVGDKGWAVENLAKKTNNRELEAKYDFYRNRTQGVAQEYINEKLFSIWDKIESSGKRESFDEYAYHLHNIDRMSLDSAEDIATRATLKETLKGLTEKQIETLASTLITRDTPKDRIDMILAAQAYVDLGGAKGKNKPVFGNSITADVSRKKVAEYEASNPEFKAWGEEVVAYNKALRELAVTEGLISQKTADLWEQMYPHYVPISRIDRNNASVSVPLDTNKTGVSSPFKRAEGGNSDFEPLLETMAKNTEQIFRAVFRNRFGVELMNTLKADSAVAQAIEEADPNEVLEGVKENDGAILKEGKNGIPASFTVFVKGKRVEFDIPDDIYEAVKPTTGELTKTYGILNKPSEALKKLNTEWKPTFALWRNPIKDSKDVLHNSQHALKTYLTAPETIKEITTKGKWFQEYAKNGGKTNSYYDTKTKTFKKKPGVTKKVLGFPIHAYQNASQNIEMFWRLSEYIASRKEGRSIEVSMLDAARVTTNFGAGGDLTKYLNRNGAFFLNPSVQGAMQIGRNVREAHHQGLKGYAVLAGKVLGVGLGGLFLNHLLWDDDEDYEELSDYVKQNYFIVAKGDDGKFIRIPKGRMEAVIQNGFEQMENLITGDDDVDLETFAELVANNLAPNNPFENNIFSTISQINKNETWYGEDLVPTRLQDLPEAEQYDESTDSISKWLGEKLNYSPYKINYLFQQYGGGAADTFLPMLTPEAESGSDSSFDNIVVAPWRDEIVTDSVLKNQNVSDFYDTVDKLTKNANSVHATDEDELMSKYINSMSSQIGELYKQKRQIQNSSLDDSTKYKRVRQIQEQINALAKESLNTYGSVNIDGGYATVGDMHYRMKDGKWTKISGDQLEKQEDVVYGLGISPAEYWRNKTEYDFAYENPEKYAVAKSVGGYSKFKTYTSELYDIKADVDKKGKTISGSRKKKVIRYINSLDADYGEKLIIFKHEYQADDTYNYAIIEYLNSRKDLSYEEMETILKELGFYVDKKGNITWD